MRLPHLSLIIKRVRLPHLSLIIKRVRLPHLLCYRLFIRPMGHNTPHCYRNLRRYKSNGTMGTHSLCTEAFGPVTWIRAGWLWKDMINWFQVAAPSLFLPACRTKFIAWCLRRPIRGMPTRWCNSYTCCVWVPTQ